MEENTRLELEHFAELARMLKYIDRHDEHEIVTTIKQEGEKEMQKAQEQLEHVNELIAETTGETVEMKGVEANVKEQPTSETSEQDKWIPFEVWLDEHPEYSAHFNRQDSRKK